MISRLAPNSTLHGPSGIKSLIGVIQICSTNDIENNFEKIKHYVGQCAIKGAKLICLPENFAFMGSTPQETDLMKESLEGPLIRRYSELAS